MATADRMFYAGWTCLFSDEFSTEGMEMQFSQYQHQIYTTPVPSTVNVSPALWCRNMDSLGRRSEYTGGYPHEVSATDTWIMLVGSCPQGRGASASDLICQPLMTSYVINAYFCLATLHAWTLEYQHMMLCV